MKNEPAAKTEKKLTPHEFWTSVKQIAELQINQAKVNRLMGLDQDNELPEAAASLSSLLLELTGCRVFPLTDSEKLASDAYRKDTGIQHQSHKHPAGSHESQPGDHQSIPEGTQDRHQTC
ncbi:hypothetical protein [Morganella morganii]|uniref:hypothetical protein n=1 Tax=Morganella morganii TaxID=582 RepID=UPI0015F00BF2|nr:hypothetical protein [Morganella morganii]MDF5910886.1 hypothetical protein [Morganella morganii]HBN5914565.1 hypothetical protein [Morganella morganii]HCK3361668.1 hypothetical protein [Morganella morganii]HCR4152212.1 hypothetical protein [Morganella morganii]